MHIDLNIVGYVGDMDITPLPNYRIPLKDMAQLADSESWVL